MNTETMDLKLTRAFGHLDVDANGHIDFDDITALASRLVSGFGEPADSPKGRALSAGFEEWWQALLAATDLDGDRRITPEEWNSGMRVAFVESDSGFDDHFRPLARAAFDLADTDGDGVVSVEEFVTWQQAFGTSAAAAREAFAHLDTDGDQALSVEELVAAARQYYTGEGGLSGDWLYGPLS
jgi:Ca2+-binding EF-hand superfamily protein